MTKLLSRGGAVFLVAAVAVATPVSAGQWRSSIVGKLLEKATEKMAENGYAETAWSKQDDLASGGDNHFQIRLDARGSYALIGVCDTDCKDMDLQLYNPAGDKVAEDVKEDDVPIVIYTAPAEGTYSLRVVMKTCGSGACNLGIKAYQKK